MQDLDRLGVAQHERFFKPRKLLVGVLLLNGRDLGGVLLLETDKDALEHPVNRLHHFVVVLLERHLEIESNEFGQVSVSVGVLGTEDWGGFEVSVQE